MELCQMKPIRRKERIVNIYFFMCFMSEILEMLKKTAEECGTDFLFLNSSFL